MQGSGARLSRRDGCALAALATLVALFWTTRVLGPAKAFTFGSADLFLYFLPMQEAVAAALRSGRVPLWNPAQAAGVPLLATQQVGALYPPHWLYALVPPPTGMALVAVLHLALATGATYGLARALGLAVVPALVAGASFGLSSPLLFTTLFPNAQEAAAWLPVGLLALLRLRERCGEMRTAFPWLVVWSAAEAAPLLTGYAQLWVVLNWVWAAAAAWLLIGAARRHGPRAARRFALAAGLGATLGLGLAAAQILPTLELARASVRQPAALSWHEIAPYGDFPYRWIRSTMIGPGHLTEEYLGLVAALLAPAALAGRRRALALAVLAGGALVYLVILGPLTPVHRLYFLVPGLAPFRFPQRLRLVPLLAIALLAALAADAIGREAALPHARRRATMVAAASALLAAALLARAGASPVPALAPAAVLAIALALPAGRAAGAVVPVLALLVLVDLWRAGRSELLTPYHAAGRALIGRHASALAALAREAPFGRLVVLGPGFDPDLAPKGAAGAGLARLDDYEPLSPERHADFLDPDRSAAPVPRVPRRFTGQVGAVPRRLLDLAGTRFVVVAAPKRTPGDLATLLRDMQPRGHLPPSPESGAPPPGPAIWENPAALPRAFVVTDWRVVEDRRALLAELADPAFPLATTALLEAPPEPHGTPPPATAVGDARIRSYAPEEVIVEVRAAGPSLLVLTDSFFPGWEARVDGAPVPILRADFLFRAVPIGAGMHEVRFTYRPRSFRIGAALSATALALLAALGIVVRLRRRST